MYDAEFEFESELEDLMAMLAESELESEVEGEVYVPPTQVYGPPNRPSSQLTRDQSVVNDQMVRGVRDENKLTDAVFYDRHPDWKGKSLKNANVSLRQEWIKIRDSIVRPALKNPSGALTNQPGHAASAGAGNSRYAYAPTGPGIFRQQCLRQHHHLPSSRLPGGSCFANRISEGEQFPSLLPEDLARRSKRIHRRGSGRSWESGFHHGPAVIHKPCGGPRPPR